MKIFYFNHSTFFLSNNFVWIAKNARQRQPTLQHVEITVAAGGGFDFCDYFNLSRGGLISCPGRDKPPLPLSPPDGKEKPCPPGMAYCRGAKSIGTAVDVAKTAGSFYAWRT
jgi:hypothetical protein